MRKAVFLDRDGTVIEERNYLSGPEQVRLIDGAAEAVRALSEAGYLIVLVSNQSGVARGYFTEEDVQAVNRRVCSEIEKRGAGLDAVYYCPHYEKGSVAEYAVACGCRKPKAGMGIRAAAEHDIDLSESYMIGDKPSDIEFGRNCGMRNAFLVSTGHGAGQETGGDGYGIMTKDIGEAAQYILEGKA